MWFHTGCLLHVRGTQKLLLWLWSRLCPCLAFILLPQCVCLFLVVPLISLYVYILMFLCLAAKSYHCNHASFPSLQFHVPISCLFVVMFSLQCCMSHIPQPLVNDYSSQNKMSLCLSLYLCECYSSNKQWFPCLFFLSEEVNKMGGKTHSLSYYWGKCKALWLLPIKMSPYQQLYSYSTITCQIRLSTLIL